MKKLVSELCQNCNNEFTVEWSDELGMVVYCPICGHRTLLCSLCEDMDCEHCKFERELIKQDQPLVNPLKTLIMIRNHTDYVYCDDSEETMTIYDDVLKVLIPVPDKLALSDVVRNSKSIQFIKGEYIDMLLKDDEMELSKNISR